MEPSPLAGWWQLVAAKVACNSWHQKRDEVMPHVLHVTSMSRPGHLSFHWKGGVGAEELGSQAMSFPLGGTGCPFLRGLEVSGTFLKKYPPCCSLQSGQSSPGFGWCSDTVERCHLSLKPSSSHIPWAVPTPTNTGSMDGSAERR